MSYDGSRRWADVEAALGREGYVQRFSCMYNDVVPDELGYTGREDGWELRRKLKAYCATSGIADYRIVRNTSYHRDLYGQRVYELWVRRDQARALASDGRDAA